LQPIGPSARVFLLGLNGAIQVCVSADMYAEYEEVIRRPRFRREESIIATTLETIRRQALWIKAPQKLRVCADPDDDIFVECAAAAQAEYLITGNIKDFPPVWGKTTVVTPRCFLQTELNSAE
jgi:putative PIN family toxin of toxin-antitoxin system